MTTSAPVREYAGVTIPASGTFELDPAHTTAGFVARHLMVSKVRGAFHDVRGTITIAEDVTASSVDATIAAASIDTGAPDRDNHLRSADFLDVERFPHLEFRASGVTGLSAGGFTLAGNLTVRGVTRPVTLDVEFDGLVTNPYGKEVIAFTASTEIDREDFGITWNVALETGGVLVGRKVKIEISAQGVRVA